MKTKQLPKYITILGDGAVGKTTLVKVLMNNEINIKDLKTKRTPFLEIESVRIHSEKLLVYDLAGQDNLAHPLRVLQDQVLGHADLIIFAFALDRFSSLAHLGSWYVPIRNYYQQKNKPFPRMLLVGTKLDQGKKIDESLIEKVLRETHIKEYIETSSVDGVGIVELKRRIITILGQPEEIKIAEKKAIEIASIVG